MLTDQSHINIFHFFEAEEQTSEIVKCAQNLYSKGVSSEAEYSEDQYYEKISSKDSVKHSYAGLTILYRKKIS